MGDHARDKEGSQVRPVICDIIFGVTSFSLSSRFARIFSWQCRVVETHHALEKERSQLRPVVRSTRTRFDCPVTTRGFIFSTNPFTPPYPAEDKTIRKPLALFGIN